MLLEITDTDRAFYEQHLTGFLPPRMIDTHTHVWLDAFRKATDTAPRGPTWPNRVASQQTVEDLAATYRAMFPASSVTVPEMERSPIPSSPAPLAGATAKPANTSTSAAIRKAASHTSLA